MDWVTHNTRQDVAFVVIEGRGSFSARNAEWFPALSGRISAAAVQGYEWRSDMDFTKQTEAFLQLQDCGFAGIACVEQFAKSNNISHTHVYVLGQGLAESTSRPCCQVLIDSLEQDQAYDLVYSNSDVAIYRKLN